MTKSNVLSNKIAGIHTTLNIIQNVGLVYVRRFQFGPFTLKNGSSNFIRWKIWIIHSIESERKILQEITFTRKVFHHILVCEQKMVSYTFTINDRKHYQTKFWESIRLWISSRMWGWYTSDVSSLAPSLWKMVPLILLNKIFQIFTDECEGKTWNIFAYDKFLQRSSITKRNVGSILPSMYGIIYEICVPSN